jgi:hypothetical protein
MDLILSRNKPSDKAGTVQPLEVEIVGAATCCSERLGNPTAFQLTAGTEVVVNVEMVLGSTASQSFTLTTSMARK